MVTQNNLPGVDSQFRLRRIPRAHNLLSLVSKPEETSYAISSPWPLRRRSTNSGSENGDVLYMAKPQNRNRRDRSLSPISNSSTPTLDRPLDGDGACSETDAIEDSAEEFSWDIIDREIYEWQYACRTGRPYWWSPRAKYTAHSKLKEVNEHPTDEYKTIRRAVSDSFLADSNTVEDMAHMIAVQLLSSCFTLPPELLMPVSTQNGSLSEKKRSTSLSMLDPPMISSLMMHTRYRHSPCFGHQGRNTSPVQFTPGTIGGPTPSSPSPPTAAGMQTPDIGTSDMLLRRQRVHRALHVTEGSAAYCSLDSHTDEYLKFCSTNDSLEHAVRTANSLQPQLSESDHDEGHVISHTPSRQREVGQNLRTDILKHDGMVAPETYRTRPKTKYELNLITRSEPHHDFVQPVKEIVVRRWQRMRQRLSGRQNSNAPRTRSEEFTFALGSRSSSPAVESDGRERRRRARASGDISSYESTPHYNSPVSSHFSRTGSGASDPPQTDYGTVPPSSALVESLAAAISSPLEHRHEDSTLGHESAFYNASTPLEDCLDCQPQNSPNGSLFGSVHSHQSRADTDHEAQPTLNSIASSPPSIRRGRARQRRKSMLSEVFTVGDLVDEMTVNESNDNSGPNISDVMTSGPPSTRNEAESTSNILSSDPNVDERITVRRKPKFSRTSTCGTQVFNPSDEGVEIDGLPVGLCRHAWDGLGRRRERSYL